MLIYVNKENAIVGIAEKDILIIEDTKTFEVTNLPENPELYDFINGKIVINEERKRAFDDLQKEIEKQNTIKSCEKYIYSFYPQSKQNSDIFDTNFYRSVLLKTYNEVELNEELLKVVDSIKNNESLEYSYEFEQLAKAYIRNEWVQACKATLKKKLDGLEVDYPIFPSI